VAALGAGSRALISVTQNTGGQRALLNCWSQRSSAPVSTASAILSQIAHEIAASRGIRPVLELLDQNKTALCQYLQDHLGSAVAAQALTLKVLNLCVARFHFLRRSTTLLSRPYGLEVDPINNCNLACPGCVHSSHAKQLEIFQWSSGVLSEERYARFLGRRRSSAWRRIICFSPRSPPT
jgi:hypothetical protein